MARLGHLFQQTIHCVLKGAIRRRRSQIIVQMYEIGNRSVLFITATLSILGMISVFQVLKQVEKIIPDFSMIGPAFIQMMIREFGPTITGLMIATRVGSGIAAEVGSMVVTEQVDALRMSNAQPVDYLVAPRFIACGIQSVMLSIYGVFVGVLAGAVTAYVFWNISFGMFLQFDLVQWGDIVSGLLKAMAYGFTIPIVASQAGLEARGGSEGVGAATTRAVVSASFAVVLLDLVLSGFSYLVLFN